ncbi:MAG: YbaK/EbsC family protein [Acidobacteria bacterium]|nr:YbaK/EbsC family protein [Acidobacteriota bacterium]
MPRRRVQTFLDENNVEYMIVEHSPAYAAMDVATAAHIADWELAKTVMVRLDGKMAMAVLPASEKVDLDAIAQAAGAKLASAALEDEFKDLFPDCQLGAMPPFGNLYNLPVYADVSLATNDLIAFNAGTHHTVIRMHYADFDRLVHPKTGQFRVVSASAAC